MGQIYALACKWSLIIIEDDAYYWLQYPHGPENVPGLNLRRELVDVCEVACDIGVEGCACDVCVSFAGASWLPINCGLTIAPPLLRLESHLHLRPNITILQPAS